MEKSTKKIKIILKRIISLMDATLNSELNLTNAQFASNYLRKIALLHGKDVRNAKVIHWGLDVTAFPYKKGINNSKRLLYVGQVEQQKGVHTIIEAMNVLVNEYKYSSLKLTVVGWMLNKSYFNYIYGKISTFNLQDNVEFKGFIPRQQLPMVYRDHDILIFPSEWDEPFGITILEAMSCGLAVIGTGTGGSSEILQHEVNGLTFPKGNVRECAEQVVRLLNYDNELFEFLRVNGRKTVEEKFGFELCLDTIENTLKGIAN